ncbi:MAG: PSD1 and planctomycete cytochrome C domain-containing protein [Phycisphaeraceae bacterium]
MPDVTMRKPARTGVGVRMSGYLALMLCIGCLATAPAQAADAASADSLDFFEKRIRPLLVERCYECHSAQATRIKGGLRLDSRDALLKGGDTGPAIDPVRVEESLLLRAVRYDDKDLQMPPKEKDRLSPQQVKDFETWIKSGVAFASGAATAAVKPDAAANHWAFQPVKDPALPAVKDERWPRTEIDRFILAKLEAAGLQPSPQADKRTLIRRATFDLHGLPPTQEEVEAFARDDSPDAFAKVVDRLLASPRYGERWGRYWLDLARYSDTKGYVYGDREERFFVHAHAYRDWVIRAFNEDLPYDRFLLLQVAADQVTERAKGQGPGAKGVEAEPQTTSSNPPSLGPRPLALGPSSQSDLAAVGFLTLGRRFLGVIHDIIDDRIDTLFRTTQGLTVGCARCHDHKFDPIPTEDYYSLYGVFVNTTERTVPVASTPPDTDAYRAFEKELRAREAKLRDAFAAKRGEWSDRVRAMSADYLLALLETDKLWTEEFYSFVRPQDVNPPFVRQWQSYLYRRDRAGFDPIFEPWHALIALRGETFAKEAATIVTRLLEGKDSKLNPRVAAALDSAMKAGTLGSMQDVARLYGTLLVETDKAWRRQVKADANAKALPDAADEALRQVLYATDSPVQVPDRSIYEAEFFFDEGTRVQLAKLAAQIDKWLITAPGATPHAVILDDIPAEHRRTARVFRRGNPATPGAQVSPHFLSLFEKGKEPTPFLHGAGRLELAQHLIDPNNPLTARVMVNRIWQHHFGTGLVATPSDFGTRAEPPSHPELLDHLAARFMREGWSVKKMHRAIMLSAVYVQKGEGDSGLKTQDSGLRTLADPANRLLSYFPRHRLDFEAMRDAMLHVTGELDNAMGGRPINLFSTPFTRRRSVYGLIDRQFFPGELRIFDVASPDLHAPTRPTTTVPQQALFFMNSPFVKERAKALAKRIDQIAISGSTEGAPARGDLHPRITAYYQALFQRNPTPSELTLSSDFLTSLLAEHRDTPVPPKLEPTAWTYGYGELDEKTGIIKSFAKLPYFTGSAWQGGPNWPDAKLGWVQLTADGGHAGNDLKHAAIRRWTAPRDMTINITGKITHEHDAGDGIRAFLVHGRGRGREDASEAGDGKRGGILSSWTLHKSSAETSVESLAVQKGDTIDFIVDIRGNLNSDDFIWKPVIMDSAPDAKAQAAMKTQWSSSAEFAGTPTAPPEPMSPWEMYAQVLLLSNEFMFVD